MVHELKKQMVSDQKSVQESQASCPQRFPEGKETKGFIAPSNTTVVQGSKESQLPSKLQLGCGQAP